jgi:hypothetical protein
MPARELSKNIQDFRIPNIKNPLTSFATKAYNTIENLNIKPTPLKYNG